jgi:hypothetical protein
MPSSLLCRKAKRNRTKSVLLQLMFKTVLMIDYAAPLLSG